MSCLLALLTISSPLPTSRGSARNPGHNSQQALNVPGFSDCLWRLFL